MQLTVLVFAVALCTVSFSEEPNSTADHASPSTVTSVKPTSAMGQQNPATTPSTAPSAAPSSAPAPSSSTAPSSAPAPSPSAAPSASVPVTSQTPPPPTPTQTHQLTEEASTGPPAQTTTANLTSGQTVSSGPTGQSTSESPGVAGNTTVAASSAGLLQEPVKADLAANPGLVAVICIFCIIFVLVLVVVLIKCFKSPRSNFQRLDDVPMGNVSEDSPFAQHSK